MLQLSDRPLEQECSCCLGAGLVRTPCLPPATALVCPRCKGRGGVPVKFAVYKGRQRLRGITKVIGAGFNGVTVTLRQFDASVPAPTLPDTPS